ncbi:helix-turn-helix transcriptional regulator [Jeotgalibaca caeni]|uniref:helix-turn-helix transcriptional regulator n=1 Tax=Jeotgalibaca caeni TaxID=3028623 RepID=UPI00237D3496|nr:helix-turn-helix domain-containing protein [Jeotgalibaca caeni]MDE1549098.1 helix-turn-helix domain-containing protein [Jeotgalibaca caeni]
MSIILSEQSLSQTFAFLFEVFRDFARFFDKMFDKRDIVAEMKEYTKKNYHQNLTLQELGKHLNYSHSYLGKKFRAEEKMSYRTYLDHVRIEEAKKLLKGDQYLVYEIAEKVGYSDSDYFYKKFKKITGTSPKSYQKTTTK